MPTEYVHSFRKVFENLSEDPDKALAQIRLVIPMIIGKRMDYLDDNDYLHIGERIKEARADMAVYGIMDYPFFNKYGEIKEVRIPRIIIRTHKREYRLQANFHRIESIYD